jgi:hypothetical protein
MVSKPHQKAKKSLKPEEKSPKIPQNNTAIAPKPPSGNHLGKYIESPKYPNKPPAAKIKMPPRGCRVGRDSFRTGKVGTHTVAARTRAETSLSAI